MKSVKFDTGKSQQNSTGSRSSFRHDNHVVWSDQGEAFTSIIAAYFWTKRELTRVRRLFEMCGGQQTAEQNKCQGAMFHDRGEIDLFAVQTYLQLQKLVPTEGSKPQANDNDHKSAYHEFKVTRSPPGGLCCALADPAHLVCTLLLGQIRIAKMEQKLLLILYDGNVQETANCKYMLFSKYHATIWLFLYDVSFAALCVLKFSCINCPRLS